MLSFCPHADAGYRSLKICATVDGNYNNSRELRPVLQPTTSGPPSFNTRTELLLIIQRLLNDRLCTVNHVRH